MHCCRCFFAVSAGRLVDRSGARWPLFGASFAVALGTLLPFIWPRLEMLYVASTLIGTGFMVFHVAISQTVGALGQGRRPYREFQLAGAGLFRFRFDRTAGDRIRH